MIVKMGRAMIVAFPLLAFAGCHDRQAPIADTTALPPPFDKFRVAIPAHWNVALSLDTGQMKLVSYVPDGQSKAHWTDMLSVIVYDKSNYADLNDVAHALAATYNNICAIPPVVAQPVMTSDNGSQASLQIARCGKDREGRAHMAIQKAIARSDGFYIVKRAWTLPPVEDSNSVAVPDAEMKAATAALNDVHLCDPQQHATACASATAARPAAQ
jgi:hypothetical protein